MKSKWKECKIAELGEVVGGATPSTKNPENYENGTISWITPKDLSILKGRFIHHGERNITEIGFRCCSTRLLPPNTVLFSSRAPIGYVAIATKEMCTNQGCKSVIPNSNTDYMFLYYLLKFNKNNIEHMGNGTTFNEVSTNIMKSIKVCIPVDITEQRRISSVLSALDAKIELNNAINENLEQQAQAIFKYWFVDFEPFGGVMPADWRYGIASEIIEFHDSQRVPLSGIERNKMKKIYPYYGATSRIDYVDNYLFDGIYLLLGEDGTVVDRKGFPILQYVYGKFWVNNHAHIITGKLGYTVESLYLLFNTINIKHIVTGAVQQKISQENLKKVSVIIPNTQSLEQFNSIIQPIFSIIRNNRDEIDRLSSIRDTLLPKLMKGEIDVSKVKI
jgi:type I restriction enzyme S subunit